MFAASIQPSVVSLFSSTGSDPLALFTVHKDASLPSDSVVHLLNDSSSLPSPPSPAIIISTPFLEGDSPGHSLDQSVLQIQSPTLHSTFMQCPPINESLAGASGSRAPRGKDLGMKHPWIHIQVRNLGREWSFEVGLVDHSGRLGVVRCSTFQKSPRLKLPVNTTSPPILHLPLSFPPSSSRPLTAWSTVALHLPRLLPQFSSRAATAHEGELEPPRNRYTIPMLPGSHYSHVSYVRVYATCRLRRIWFSEAGPSQKLPWEFELYGA